MVEHAIQDDLHATLVYLLNQLGKELIAGLKILFICNSVDISRRLLVLKASARKAVTLIVNYSSIVGINVVVILYIILMVGW